SLASGVSHARCPGLGESTRRHAHGGRVAGCRDLCLGVRDHSRGVEVTVEVPHHQFIRKLTGRRLDRAIIAVLAVALTYVVVDKFWISKRLSTNEPVAAAARRGRACGHTAIQSK